jgi:hypothetical protein
MKNVLVLLMVYVLFGFSTNPEPEITLKVVKIKWFEGSKYDLGLEFYNNSGQKISYLSMYCSDRGFYVTDNENVTVVPKPCDKNFPTKVNILRNKYRTGDLQLELNKNAKEAQFKVGFRYMKIPETIQLSEFDTTAAKSVTVWSNTIKFKTR